MRILCGTLSSLVGLNLLWLIFTSGGQRAGELAGLFMFYGTMLVVLLWIAAGPGFVLISSIHIGHFMALLRLSG